MMHQKRFISVKYPDVFIHPHYWMNHNHLYRGLELTRYLKCRGGTMLSQTGPLTGILWNLMPLNRISLLNKELLQFHIRCQLTFHQLTLVESDGPWSCAEELGPDACLPSYKSTHKGPLGTWGRFVKEVYNWFQKLWHNDKVLVSCYLNKISSTTGSFFTIAQSTAWSLAMTRECFYIS